VAVGTWETWGNMKANMMDGVNAGMMDGTKANMMDGVNAGMMSGMKANMMDGVNAGMMDGMKANMMDGVNADSKADLKDETDSKSVMEEMNQMKMEKNMRDMSTTEAKDMTKETTDKKDPFNDGSQTRLEMLQERLRKRAGHLIMFDADMALATFRPEIVDKFAESNEAWREVFDEAWIKMSEIGMYRKHGRVYVSDRSLLLMDDRLNQEETDVGAGGENSTYFTNTSEWSYMEYGSIFGIGIIFTAALFQMRNKYDDYAYRTTLFQDQHYLEEI